MKWGSKILLVLLISVSAVADQSIEFIGGSLTQHLMPFRQYNNYYQPFPGGPTFTSHVDEYDSLTGQIGSGTGLIHNPLFGFRYNSEDDRTYWSASGFWMNNSVGQPASGLMGSLGRKFYSGHLYVGAVLGAYEQDDATYYQSGINPYYITKIGGTDIVPIIGFEASVRVNLNSTWFVKLNNIFTPLLTNTTLSLGMSF